MFDELEGAVGRNELDLVFQPKVDLQTSAYIGSEVLVRWRNRLIGDVPPSIFIPLAERSGLIGPVGAWVVTQVISRFLSLPSCIRSKTLAINVSGGQLQNPCFVPWLCDALDEAAVPGESIEIELTETALMADTRLAARRLKVLSDRGITITLDDFGTGYSALSHLRDIPVDVVKIAPDFISDMIGNSSSSRLVGAVISMAKSLDLSVVAEGVETIAQAERLTEFGCDIGQGYLFSRPLALEALVSWVTTSKYSAIATA